MILLPSLLTRLSYLLLCFLLERRSIHAFRGRTATQRQKISFLAATPSTLPAAFDEPNQSWLTLKLTGWSALTASDQRPFQAAVLTALPSSDDNDTPRAALVLPLENEIPQKQLLQAAHAATPLTPLQLLRMNAYAINRDNGLFDQLPYTLWTVDKDNQWKDAAGNPITSLYHGGKRQAYQWFLGKDWKSYLSRNDAERTTGDDVGSSSPDIALLNQRIAELQRQELEMELADLEQQCAVASTQGERCDILQARRKQIRERLQSKRESVTPASVSNKDIENAPDMSLYTSPYAMFRDLLQNQMKAEVIATVLENMSFLDGNIVLGGAIVLRRIVATQPVKILGETVEVRDESETYGNPNQIGGTTIIVECHADEAIGMSLACHLPCQIDLALWEKGSVMVAPTTTDNKLREWMVQDTELSVLMEGEALQNARSERALPVRVPRSQQSLFDRILAPRTANTTALFPTDNPIQSLEQYDTLNTQDKVRTLLGLSNFNGRLPRPRTIRANPAALDNLLLPLVDESVRWQYRMRDAQQRGDTALVETLLQQKSRKQIALEKAQMEGNTWTDEADFLSSLRADPTQDEGSYSRFLDRDEWYERQRQEQSKRVNRSQFGSLLDDVE